MPTVGSARSTVTHSGGDMVGDLRTWGSGREWERRARGLGGG